MNPWLFPWLNLFKSPLSGDVTQDYAPITSWWSPNIELNFAGDKRIESQVVSDVASYGRQLGILTEAILSLAEGKDSPEIDRLRELAERINTLKRSHSDHSTDALKSKLLSLKHSDQQAFDKLLSEVSQ